MPQKIYALLVGINKYPELTPNLYGAVNDNRNFDRFLSRFYPDFEYKPRKLKNDKATRENIIKGFEEHLFCARKGDIVLFLYSGHGSRQPAAPEFKPFYAEGEDETLVAYNSRIEGEYDIADKELAVLIDRVAQTGAHVVVILDCCYAGSGTRSRKDSSFVAFREMEEIKIPRSLDSYIFSYFEKQKPGPFRIPRSQHVLLAACSRDEQAVERISENEEEGIMGIFSAALLAVLEEYKGEISYTDLFRLVRRKVRSQVPDQTPEFTFYKGIDPDGCFLTSKQMENAKRSHPPRLYFDRDKWVVEMGALHDLGPNPKQDLIIQIVQRGKGVGKAEVVAVGVEKSEVRVMFESPHQPSQEEMYEAKLLALSQTAFEMSWKGLEVKDLSLVEKQIRIPNVKFISEGDQVGIPYELTATKELFQLWYRPGKVLLQRVSRIRPKGQSADSVEDIVDCIENVVTWERLRRIQNPLLFQGAKEVEISFTMYNEETGTEIPLPDRAKLSCKWLGDKSERIRIMLKVRNQTGRKIYFSLFHLHRSFRISSFANEPVLSGTDWTTLFGDGDDIGLPDGDVFFSNTDTLTLIYSEEELEHSLIAQGGIEIGGMEEGRLREKTGKEEKTGIWSARTFEITLVKEWGRVGKEDLVVMEDVLIVKSHPSLHPKVYVEAAQTYARMPGMEMIPAHFFRSGSPRLLDFSQKNEIEASLLSLKFPEGSDLEELNIQMEREPMLLEVNPVLHPGEKLWVIGYDGSQYYLVDVVEPEAGRNPLVVCISNLGVEGSGPEPEMRIWFFAGEKFDQFANSIVLSEEVSIEV